MAVHKSAQFCNNPRLLQKHVIRRIAEYLMSTSTHVDVPYGNRRLSTCGVVYNTDKEKGITCYVNVDFAGGWAKADANNVENFMLSTGYVIKYTGCPVLWCSKLQTEIYLSKTAVEYITLIQAMCNIIPFTAMMKEVSFIFDIHLSKPEAFCKVLEDNKI